MTEQVTVIQPELFPLSAVQTEGYAQPESPEADTDGQVEQIEDAA